MIQNVMKAFLFVILGTTMLLGQGTTGTILGTVMDETGAVIPGITVTLSNLDTGSSRSLVSDDSGRYRATGLEVGAYEVKGELTGFQTAIRTGIQLSVGRNAVVDLTMTVGNISEQVTVTGEASLVETTDSTLSGLVTTIQIQDLPINGRNFNTLTLLEAGVSNAMAATAHNGSLITGFGLDITIAGGRPNTNTFLLDGTDINDHRYKLPGSVAGISLGVDSVREFKMLTSNFSAEHGRAGGGVVVAITKSGTNEFHGSLFHVLRNDNLDATNFFGNSTGTGKAPLARNQFGASVGGPIVKDRTFFFASWESLRDRRGQTRIVTVPTAEAREGNIPGLAPITVADTIKPYLFLWPLPNGRDFGDGRAEHSYTFSDNIDEDYLVTKIDHNLSDSHSFFGRYTIDYAEKVGDSNTVVLAGLGSHTQYATLEEKWIVSPNLLNVISYALARTSQTDSNIAIVDIPTSLYYIPDAGQLGSANVSGILSANPRDNRPREYTQNMFQFSDSVSWNKGSHSLKFGTDIKRYQYNTLSVSRFGGRWAFDDLAAYLVADPNRIEAQIPGADFRRGLRQTVFGFYVQDDFRWRPNLTLNIGLRYEPMQGNNEVNKKFTNLDPETALELEFESEGARFKNPSKKNFSPRIGLVWDPSGDGKTSIRAAYGVFHNVVALYWFQQSAFRMPPAQTFTDRSDLIWPDPFGGAGVPAPITPENPSGSITVFSFPSHGLNNPYMQKWNLNIQRELVPGTVATIGYVGSRGVNLVRLDQFQACAPEFSGGRQFFREGCPDRSPAEFTRIETRTSTASSFYHGFIAKMTRRFSEGLFLQGSYTWSKSIDDMSSAANANDFPTSSWQGTYDDPDLVRGPSDFDVRHNLVVNGSWALPGADMRGLAGAILGNWQVNGILSVNSGFPLTPRVNRRWGFHGSPSGAFMPNLKSGGDPNPVLGGPDKYFDDTQFEVNPRIDDPAVLAGCGPAPNRCTFFGDLGRNTLSNPGVATFDFGVMKKWRMAFLGEAGAFEFRGEFFNIFNRANFGSPSLEVFDRNGARRSSVGRITTTNTTERQVQIGLKIIF